MAAAAGAEGGSSTELSHVFEQGERLDSGEREGAGVIARFIGEDGVRLWRGVQEAIRKYYGLERMREVRKTIFRLAWKASILYSRGTIKVADVASINEPLMDTMESLFNTATAESRCYSTNVAPLSALIKTLHDALLDVLRKYVKESVMKPELALSLTNTFIGVGNEAFLNPVMNDDDFVDARARVADATARLLYRFRHPSFLAGLPSERRCKTPGCFLPRTYGGLCIDHGLARHQRMLEQPTLGSAITDSRKMGTFAQWLRDAHPDALRLFSLWRACSAYRATSSAALRLVKAQAILDKHLAPASSETLELPSGSAAAGCSDESDSASASRRRVSGASASLAWMPAELVCDVRRRVADATEWGSMGEQACRAATAKYVAAGAGAAADAGAEPAGTFSDLSSPGMPLQQQPAVCSSDLFGGIEGEAFDRLDVLFQREFTATEQYAAAMEAISDAITTPRSSTSLRGSSSRRLASSGAGAAASSRGFS